MACAFPTPLVFTLWQADDDNMLLGIGGKAIALRLLALSARGGL